MEYEADEKVTPPDAALQLRRRLEQVRGRVDAAARAAGRPPDDVELLLVSKTVAAERLELLGPHVPFGENRVQELSAKALDMDGFPIAWHFIGHLQRNKVKALLNVPGLVMVQSLDRIPPAEELDRRCQEAGHALDVLVQVNTSGEASKFGASPEEAPGLARRVDRLDSLRLKGLMTIGPHTDDSLPIRRSFQALRTLRDRLSEDGVAGGQLPTLSMGMSADFPIAVAEGSTLIRVGRAVFGDRPPGGAGPESEVGRDT